MATKRKKFRHQKAIIAGIAYAVLFAGISERIAGTDKTAKCGGEEYWEQKILTDDSVTLINRRPLLTTIEEINQIDSESERRSKNNQRLSFEKQIVTVRGVIIKKVILEDDNDFHLVLLQDAEENHLIGEIPDPECKRAQASLFIDDFSKAHESMLKHARDFQHWKFDITGVLFKDRSHNQTGKADNDIEIHPILKLRAVEKLHY